MMATETWTDKPKEETLGKRGLASRAKLLVGVLLVVGLFALARQFNAQDLLKNALEWVRGLGSAGPLIFLCVYVLATVFFLPGSILTPGTRKWFERFLAWRR